MRHISIFIFLIIFFLNLSSLKAFSAIKCFVEYSNPVDYSKLSEVELYDKAKVYYYNAQKAPEGVVTKDVTQALIIYAVLERMNSECVEYPLRQGVLYDKLNKNRYAKGCFFRAIGIDSSKPDAYFYLGKYYYKREMYGKALKYYSEAYKKGFYNDYDTLYGLGDIYEKLGDTRSALRYLIEAEKQSPNIELECKINKIEARHAINKEFYSNTRLHP